MKSNKYLFFIHLLLFCPTLKAQITFQKTFGGLGEEQGEVVQETTDGGYIVVGRTESFGAGTYDVYLIKTDANGDTLWTRTFGGTNADWGNSVQQTTDGGYIIAGTSYGSFGNFSSIYLVKTDANGDTLWTKIYGGGLYDIGNSVQQTTDGGYIIAGYTDSFGAGGEDFYLIKTNSNGDTLWTKIFGGMYLDWANFVRQCIDGGYIIIGRTSSFGAGNYDIYLIKTDSTGNSLWTKTFGGGDGEYGTSIQQTTDGGYIISAFAANITTNDLDFCLIKTNSNGDTIWTKTYGGTGHDYGISVQQTSGGGYIVVGATYSFAPGTDVYLIKTDTVGDLLWTKTYGALSNDGGFSVLQTTDGGYIITGYTNSFGAGNSDVYLIKTDANGNTGCNQGNPASIITQTTIQVINPLTIVFSPPTATSTPATLVGNGAIVNTLCSTGINEIITDNSFLIAPNPSTGDFIISLEAKIMKGNVEILNILGENVFAVSVFNESKKEIRLKNISNGIYFVKVFDGEKNYCKKLIVE